MGERTFVLFLFLGEVFVFFLENVALVFLFLFDGGRNRELVVDDFVDHDLAVIGHRRAQTTERRRGDEVVLAGPLRGRRNERCGIVEVFLFLFLFCHVFGGF